ncbi:MAG: hypothetical protein ACRC3B_23845 [Bacteroidia bacterium]
MYLLRVTGIRALLIFAVLFAVLLPFPFTLFPDTGTALRPVSSPVIEAFGEALSLLPENYEARFDSDSRGMYVLALFAALLSMITAAVWTSIKKQEHNENHWLRSCSAYYLALTLLIYGFDKVFKHQFYLPEPNTLHTSLGNIPPDLLYWSTVGSSWSYSFFTGIIEVIAALMLIFRRTRGFGALLAVGVLMHVSLINFGFDISVKLFSGFLLLLTLIVAFPALKKIIRLFIFRKEQQPDESTSLLMQKTGKRNYYIIKLAIVVLFLTESLYGFVRYAGFNDDNTPRPFLHGAYTVTEQQNDSGQFVLPFIPNPDAIQRIFIHRKGYLITQSATGEMKDYALVYDTVAHQLIIRHEQEPVMVWNYTVTGKQLTLRNNDTPAFFIAESIDWKNMPLISQEWRWFID